MANAYRDQNSVPTLLGASNVDGFTPVRIYADPVTHRLLVDLPGGSGTVTEIDTGTGLTGGPITTSGTIALDSKLAPLDTLGTAGQLIRVNAGRTALEYFTASSGGVASVVGTTNRISVDATDPANPIVDISAAYVGQSSITTLGTIGTGTWAGTAVAVNHGGTGGTSASITLFNNITGLSAAGTTGTTSTNLVFSTSPTLVTPVIGVATGTSLAVTGTLSAGANSGTNGSLKLFGSTSGDVTIKAAAAAGTGTNFQLPATNGSNTNVLQTDGSGNTSWTPAATGTVTAVSVATANGFAGTSSGGATPALTLTTSVNSPLLSGNGTAIAAATTTGSGTTAVLSTTPTFTTSIITPKIVGGSGTTGTQLTLQTTSGNGTTDALVIAGGNNGGTTFATFTTGALSIGTSGALTTGTIELGAASDTTLSRVSAGVMAVEGSTVGMLPTAQTWTGQNKFNNIIDVNNAVTVSSNAGTVPITFRLNTFTNSSAATMAITMATTSAVNGQMTIVRIYDATAAAQTIGWTNTENSTVSVPTTSNGSTTLPLTVGFMFNGATSLWRCIAVA